MGVVRARHKPCFTTVGTCPADVPGDSERESTPSGTQADFWRSVQDTGVARVTSNRAQRSGPRCARWPAAGRVPRPRPGSRRGGRPGPRARTGRPPGPGPAGPPGGSGTKPRYAATTASAKSGSRSKRSRLPRSDQGEPAWANSQSTSAVTARVSGSTSTFLGLRSLCTRQCRRSTSRRSWAWSATAARASRVSRGPAEPLLVGGHPGGQVRGGLGQRTDRQRRVGEHPGPRHHHVGEASEQHAQLLPHGPAAARIEAWQQQVEPLPRHERRHQQPRQVVARLATPDLQDPRHRQQPTDQLEHRRVDVGGVRAAPRGPGPVDAHHGPLAGVRADERLTAEAAGQRGQLERCRLEGGAVHAAHRPRPHYCSMHGRGAGRRWTQRDQGQRR